MRATNLFSHNEAPPLRASPDLVETFRLFTKIALKGVDCLPQLLGHDEKTIYIKFPSSTIVAKDKLEKLFDFCKSLACYGGLGVNLVVCNNTYKFENPLKNCRLEFPNTYPNFQAKEVLANLAYLSLINSSPEESPTIATLSKSISALLSKNSSHSNLNFKLQSQIPGEVELVLDIDFNKIFNSEFTILLEEIANLGVQCIVLSPDLIAAVKTIKELLGEEFPWALNISEENKTIEIQTTKESFGQFSKSYLLTKVQQLATALGLKVSLGVLNVEGECFVQAPSEDGKMANFLCTDSKTLKHSNIVLNYYPYRPGKHAQLFIKENFNSRGKFTVNLFDENQVVDSEAEKKSQSYINTLIKNLGLEREASAGKPKVVALRNVKLSRDLNKILLLSEILNSLSINKETSFTLGFPRQYIDHQDFFLQIIPANTDWRLEGQDITILRSRSPELLPQDLKENYKLCFGRSLAIQRNPARTRGLRLNPNLKSKTSNIEQVLFHKDAIEITLPIGFGLKPTVEFTGGSFVVYSQISNLPTSYIDYYKSRLYAVPLPVYFEEDYQAKPCSSLGMLKDIARYSVPRSIFIHKVQGDDTSFQVHYYVISGQKTNPGELKKWKEALSLCSDRTILFNEIVASTELSELISSAPFLDYKNFLAGVILPNNDKASEAQIKQLHEELINPIFSCQSEKQLVNLTELPDSVLVDNAFSLDPINSKLIEDAFSIEETKDDQGKLVGYEIGIHVVNVAHLIPFGSVADISACINKAKKYLNDGDAAVNNSQAITIDMLPRATTRYTTFLDVDTPALSLYIDVDLNGRIKAGSAFRWKCSTLSTTTNYYYNKSSRRIPTNNSYDKGRLEAELDFLRKFLRHNNISRDTLPPGDLATPLLQFFNRNAQTLLKGLSIAVPSLDHGHTKFNTAAREFLSLVAQRQLFAYISKKDPLSKEQVNSICSRDVNNRVIRAFFRDIFSRMFVK